MEYVLTYGIAYIKKQNGKRELITNVPSVTTNESVAKQLVSLCNDRNLSPEHLADVVDDLISST